MLKVAEVAERLNVARSTVHRWIKDGKLKAVSPEGVKLIRIPESELEKFLGK